MKILVAAALAVAIAGCSANTGVVESWSAGGCSTASTSTDQLTVCGDGWRQVYQWDGDSRPAFTCSVEWKHNGTVQMDQHRTCRPGDGLWNQVLPTAEGRLEWTLDAKPGGLSVRCALQLGDLRVVHDCARVNNKEPTP